MIYLAIGASWLFICALAALVIAWICNGRLQASLRLKEEDLNTSVTYASRLSEELSKANTELKRYRDDELRRAYVTRKQKEVDDRQFMEDVRNDIGILEQEMNEKRKGKGDA